MRHNFLVQLIFIVVIISGCKQKADKIESKGPKLFTLLSGDSTNIHFSNDLKEGLNTNVLMYEYFYNGAGVAIADVNGDGLEDIYFTANMSDNKLYLNKGNMKFEDITQAAGVVNRPAPWRTGVTIADVNGDNKPDIFVSYSGKVRGENRISQLFINEGNNAAGIPAFTDKANEYGLADSAYCTQTFFFDYDLDGDLDMFSLNHNPNNLPVLDEASTANMLKQTDPAIGVRLFKNDNNHFTDITQKAGFSSSLLTYGLGAGISDINGDGWPDIYIANDYNVPDYLYINNKNGSFTDKLQSSMGHTSKSSMGNNVSDINNDGLPDVFVLDMLPEDNKRQKLLFAPDNYEKFEVTLRSGFYYQYMRNTLQLNNGDGSFSEIGQLAGISNTDWSWAPLFADYNNDGWKDLYITNGYTRDYTNMDFLKYMNDYIKEKGRLKREDVLGILQQMPASDVSNYIFKNNGDLTFTDAGDDWGTKMPSNSNGAAYADLDNDGDLDLVVNNVNKPAFIFRNESNHTLSNHYLNIKLKGAGKNTNGIGAKLFLYQNKQIQMLEQMPARGFQSTVTSILHFGTGADAVIDSLKVIWPGGKEQLLTKINTNQLLTLEQSNATAAWQPSPIEKSIFTATKSPISYTNVKNENNDFKRQPLLLNPLSFSGPCMEKADINGDGLEDIFVGGGEGQPGSIFIQQPGNRFIQKTQPAFDADKNSEDAAAAFADVNNDGAIDLYVASGGYHNFLPADSLLQDRLYMNDGKGNFTKAKTALPAMTTSTGCIKAADINKDGFIDFFAGGRAIPGRYPEIPQSYILLNDGKGNFTDKTSSISPEVQHAGMITDAAWLDINNDKQPDLIITGEWMPVSIFINENGKLTNKTNEYFDKKYSGWWNKLLVKDINGDGKDDLLVGNMGLNTQCKASYDEPAEMYYKDFDNNGAIEPIFCFYIQHHSYPYITRDELLEQVSAMRTRFTSYQSYADATVNNIFTQEEMKDAGHLEANYLKTALFIRQPDGKFAEKPLPAQVQFSPVFTITPLDYNKDGNTDLLFCGNINKARLRFGKYDASYGTLLKGDGKGNFEYINQVKSGFHIRGDVRSVININNLLLFGVNQNELQAYQMQ